MAHIILVTGGARSGKSDYAQQQAEALSGPRCFVATCSVHDNEMIERIERHRKARKEADWHTIEEPYELEKVFSVDKGYKTYLVDCLTLWISNIYEKSSQQGAVLEEDDIEKHVRKLFRMIREKNFTVLLVTNEVGMGIVPENAIARKYRDLVGRCNRVCAQLANEVVLVSVGLPLRLK